MTTQPVLRIACLQAAGTPRNVEANLLLLEESAVRAHAAGAHLLMTPEMFVTGYDCGAVEELAEDMPLAIRRIKTIARSNNLGLLVGLPRPLESDGIGNCALFIDENGTTLSARNKTHLYGAIDCDRFVPGDEAVTIVDFHGVRIAILICYEIEFPENARAAALAGADLIAVPTANMKPYGKINEHLIWTRAWENQVYVAYINHCGRENATEYVGLSSVVAPDGSTIALAGNGPDLIVADIDLSVKEQSRRAFSYLNDRQPQLYSSLAKQLVTSEKEPEKL